MPFIDYGDDMMRIMPGTRLVQTANNVKTKTFTLMNQFLKFEATINSKAAKLLFLIKELTENEENQTKIGKIIKKNSKFIDTLQKYGILTDKEIDPSCNYPITFVKKSVKKPLTCLNIELTTGCNLACIHCYGKFGNNKPEYINTEKLLALIPELNSLGCKAVSFTGGECTLHPDFIKIVESFVYYGFDITIFTNGFQHNKIQELLSKYDNYPFIIKVSLDGKKDMHDYIRGRKGSYDSVIELLDFLNQYNRIRVFLSCTVMKSNISQVNEFKNFIEEKYPRFVFSMSLIFSMCNDSNECFTTQEFDDVYDNCPNLFELPEKKKRKNRCSGGISQCTIMPNGLLKICNAACDPRFYIEKNAFDVGIKEAWCNCGRNIEFFRHEKNKNTANCKHCKIKSSCTMNDCRILALAYKKDHRVSNPFVCYATKKHLQDQK